MHVKVIVLFLYTGCFLAVLGNVAFVLLEFPNATCVVRGAWCVVRGAWCVVRGNTITESFCARTKTIPDRASVHA